jgi:hypothetical protein
MSIARNYVVVLVFCWFLCDGGPASAQSASGWRYEFDGTEGLKPSGDTLECWTVIQNGRQSPLPLERAGNRWLIGRLGDGILRGRFIMPRSTDAVEIRLGLHVIGSWDGEHDDDRLTIRINDAEVFSETFSNTTFRQSYPARRSGVLYSQRTGAWAKNVLPYRFAEPGVYDGVLDALYMLTFTRPIDDTVVVVDIEAHLRDQRTGLQNESWAVSMVQIEALEYWSEPTTPANPAPHQAEGVAGYPIEDFPGLLMLPVIEWFPFRIRFWTVKDQ